MIIVGMILGEVSARRCSDILNEIEIWRFGCNGTQHNLGVLPKPHLPGIVLVAVNLDKVKWLWFL